MGNLLGSLKDSAQLFAPMFLAELRRRFDSHPLLASTKDTFNLGGESNFFILFKRKRHSCGGCFNSS